MPIFKLPPSFPLLPPGFSEVESPIIPVQSDSFPPSSITKAVSPIAISPWHPREFRLATTPESVEKKLRKQREAAQAGVNRVPPPRRGNPQSCPSVTTRLQPLNGRNIGIFCSIGRRPEMEDCHLAISCNLYVAGQTMPSELFAIFDGHNGVSVARDLETELPKHLFGLLEEMPELSDMKIWNAFKMACIMCDRVLKQRYALSGSTAIIALQLGGDLWIACVGDSRAIWSKTDGSIEQLSEDAKPEIPKYTDSIHKRGGSVSIKQGHVPRINGFLSIARSFGDADIRSSFPIAVESIYCVSARPKIVRVKESEFGEWDYLILCCDGITDVLSSREIGEQARDLHRQHKLPDAIAGHLVRLAYSKGSHDNLSILVIPLTHHRSVPGLPSYPSFDPPIE